MGKRNEFMADKTIKQSLWIGIIVSLLDQAYHIARGFPHQIFDITNPETMYYIGFKFLIIFAVSFFAFKNFNKEKIFQLSIGMNNSIFACCKEKIIGRLTNFKIVDKLNLLLGRRINTIFEHHQQGHSRGVKC